MRISLFMLALCLCSLAGCTASLSAPALRHDEVFVPAEFRGARVCVGDVSDHERYVEAYEDAWWKCVGLYFKDIDRERREADAWGIGWPSEVQGYADGFRDAESQIKEIMRQYGKPAAMEALRRCWECP